MNRVIMFLVIIMQLQIANLVADLRLKFVKTTCNEYQQDVDLAKKFFHRVHVGVSGDEISQLFGRPLHNLDLNLSEDEFEKLFNKNLNDFQEGRSYLIFAMIDSSDGPKPIMSVFCTYDRAYGHVSKTATVHLLGYKSMLIEGHLLKKVMESFSFMLMITTPPW